MILSELYEAHGLRDIDPEAIVDQHAGYCRDSFRRLDDPEAVPVLIAARNEREDLPATLLALARSDERPIAPIVVDNGSDDETALFACKLGATTIAHAKPGKAGALQQGIGAVLEARSNDGRPQTILNVDADTLVSPRWSASMEKGVDNHITDGEIGLHYGLVLFSHGNSRMTDIARSVVINSRQAVNIARAKPPRERGPNTAMSMNRELLDLIIEQIPEEVFFGDDTKLREVAMAAGGMITGSLDPRTTVVTRGDRFDNLGQLVSELMGRTTREYRYTAEAQKPLSG